MAEYSLFWDGITGDGGPYNAADFTDAMVRALLNGTGNRGVLNGWLNELVVTNGGALNAAVDTGAAILYGLFYESDAAETVALPNNSTVHVVVRRSWAAQTARLTQVAALVQNPGVTYDIPLAEVTTLGGIITLITDERTYCQFSTIPGSGSVATANIQNNAVTTGKLADVTRWVSRGGGELYPDSANWAAYLGAGGVANYPYGFFWSFTDGATDAAWCTFLVPADFTGASVSIYYWVRSCTLGHTGDVRLDFSAYVASSGGVIGNQTGAVTWTIPEVNDLMHVDRVLIGTINVAAGNIVHMQVYRDGTHMADTYTEECRILIVEAAYTADS